MKMLLKLIIGIYLLVVTPSAWANNEAALKMRNAFYSILNESSPGYSVDKFNKIIYFPPQDMFNEEEFSSQSCKVSPTLSNFENMQAVYSFCGIAQVHNNPSIWGADSLFQLGKKASQNGLEFPVSKSQESLKSKDVLIVIVPGIFGEFIEQWAFDEVLRADSVFKEEFSKAIKNENQKNNINDCSAQDVLGQSTSCDMQDLLKYIRDESLAINQSVEIVSQPNGAKSVALDKLFHVGSFDKEGTPWARIALLNVEGMSLESLGDSRQRAEIFNRRLDKLFKVIGRVPKNIIFVGYSRGTNFALDMLSLAQERKAEWLPNVQSLISLGGVVFGSALADEVIVDAEAIAYKEMQLLKLLRNTLTTVPASEGMAYHQSRFMALNTLAWIKFINEYIALKVPGAKSELEYLRQQGLWVAATKSVKIFFEYLQKISENNGATDPSSAVNLVLKQAKNFGLFPDLDKFSTPSVKVDVEAILNDIKKAEEFDFDAIGRLFSVGKDFSGVLINQYQVEGLAKYNADILRFQKFVDAVAVGVEQLSTDSRLQWWSQNKIPIHVKYYSLAATMDKKTSDLVNNKLGYNPGSPDDEMLSDNWDKFKKLKTLNSMAYYGSVLNDSQVSIFKTYFWPHLIAQLNSQNTGIQSASLGILGTHHWGLALPIVNKVKVLKEGSQSGLLETNPYPRVELLKAITITVLTGDQNE